jgi:hypothetical protein
LLSSEFVLPCYTNQEKKKVLVENHTQIGTQETEDNEQSQEEEEEEGDNSEEIQEEEIPLRRSSRQIQPSTKLKDFVTYSVKFSIQDYISYDHITNEHYVFLSSLSLIKEPTTYEVAKIKPKWCRAMNEELYALEKKIKLERFIIYQKIKNRLDANRYIKLNIIAMVLLNTIKLD